MLLVRQLFGPWLIKSSDGVCFFDLDNLLEPVDNKKREKKNRHFGATTKNICMCKDQ